MRREIMQLSCMSGSEVFVWLRLKLKVNLAIFFEAGERENNESTQIESKVAWAGLCISISIFLFCHRLWSNNQMDQKRDTCHCCYCRFRELFPFLPHQVHSYLFDLLSQKHSDHRDQLWQAFHSRFKEFADYDLSQCYTAFATMPDVRIRGVKMLKILNEICVAKSSRRRKTYDDGYKIGMYKGFLFGLSQRPNMGQQGRQKYYQETDTDSQTLTIVIVSVLNFLKSICRDFFGASFEDSIHLRTNCFALLTEYKVSAR